MQPVICFGEALIDMLHVGDEVYHRYPGGAPANVAVALARLGGNARFAGQVGADSFGEVICRALTEYGVNTELVLRHPRANTAMALVSLDDAGERSFSFYREQTADLLLTPAQISDKWFHPGGIFHLCSNTLTTPLGIEVTAAAIDRAKQQGMRLSVDVNLRHNLWPDGRADRAVVQAVVARAELLKFCRDELEYLSEGQGQAYIDACLARGASLVVVTDGSGPVRYYTRQGAGTVAVPATEVVDTTGAGDSFVGALLYALTREDGSADLADAPTLEGYLDFAVQCGALTVSRPGAYPSFPTFEQVSRYWPASPAGDNGQ